MLEPRNCRERRFKPKSAPSFPGTAGSGRAKKAASVSRGREVTTGAVSVRVPRGRDRGGNADGGKIGFRSSLAPPHPRKAKPSEEPLPSLHLNGVSAGDFSEAPRLRQGRLCRGRKTSNALGALPKSPREKAKSDLRDIRMAETGKEVGTAFDLFVATCRNPWREVREGGCRAGERPRRTAGHP